MTQSITPKRCLHAQTGLALSALLLTAAAPKPVTALTQPVRPEISPVCTGESFKLTPNAGKTLLLTCQLSGLSRRFAHSLRVGELATIIVQDEVDDATIGMAIRVTRTRDGLCSAAFAFVQHDDQQKILPTGLFSYRADRGPSAAFDTMQAMQNSRKKCGQRFFDATAAMVQTPEREVPAMISRSWKYNDARKFDTIA